MHMNWIIFFVGISFLGLYCLACIIWGNADPIDQIDELDECSDGGLKVYDVVKTVSPTPQDTAVLVKVSPNQSLPKPGEMITLRFEILESYPNRRCFAIGVRYCETTLLLKEKESVRSEDVVIHLIGSLPT